MAEKKKTIAFVAGATAGASVVPFVAAKYESTPVAQLGPLGTASALTGILGGVAALYLSMKGKRMSENTRHAVMGFGLGLLSTGLARAVVVPAITSSGISSGQVRRVGAAPPPMASLVRASPSV